MWTLDDHSAVPLWRAEDSGALLAFSTRRGGVSAPPYDALNLGRSTRDRPDAVAENRRRVFDRLGLDLERLANAGQIHGSTVTSVSAPGLHPDCDALLTTVPGIALAITTADCLPILYSTTGGIAGAHSGWRGTAAGIPAVTLRALCAATAQPPDRVQVHLGPCIRSCCYAVGPEVAQQFPARAVARVDGAWRLDLVLAARLQLEEAGVHPDRVAEVSACTACNPAWYFSHRRDRGETGRHWAIAALPG